VLTKGWDRAFLPGWFEVFADRRLLGPVTVVLDVAHNVDSVARLLTEAGRSYFAPLSSSSSPSVVVPELWALFGTGSDKDAAGMLAQLVLPPQGEEEEEAAGGGLWGLRRRVVLCQAANARAVPVEALAALAARARSGSPAPLSSASSLSAAAAVVVDAAVAGMAPGAVLDRLVREA
jgi:folylpolyglutamate synthase/dihydropteroate synthase